jgi:bacteriocin biosynthesis cyclodehydratase domain-containing protein
MCGMVLRLDPRVPLVWRTPDSIQLGIDRPLAVIDVTPALERVVAALSAGVPREGAFLLGKQAGASEPEIDGLLRALGPVLLTGPISEPPSAGPVCVDGSGMTADRIRALLRQLDIPVLGGEAGEAALAVIVGHYVLAPERYGRWLRRDTPHLPVVFSDTEVRFGPIVEPGAGPCLGCLELSHIDDDPVWPAIAVQLLLRRAPTETARLSIQVASRVVRMIENRLVGVQAKGDGLSYAADAATGVVRRRVHRPHERCGCRSLPESESVRGELAAAPRIPPN